MKSFHNVLFIARQQNAAVNKNVTGADVTITIWSDAPGMLGGVVARDTVRHVPRGTRPRCQAAVDVHYSRQLMAEQAD